MIDELKAAAERFIGDHHTCGGVGSPYLGTLHDSLKDRWLICEHLPALLDAADAVRRLDSDLAAARVEVERLVLSSDLFEANSANAVKLWEFVMSITRTLSIPESVRFAAQKVVDSIEPVSVDALHKLKAERDSVITRAETAEAEIERLKAELAVLRQGGGT